MIALSYIASANPACKFRKSFVRAADKVWATALRGNPSKFHLSGHHGL
jgi:hypothetical protein